MNPTLVTGLLVLTAVALAIVVEVQLLFKRARAMKRLQRRRLARTQETITVAPSVATDFAQMLPVAAEPKASGRGRAVYDFQQKRTLAPRR